MATKGPRPGKKKKKPPVDYLRGYQHGRKGRPIRPEASDEYLKGYEAGQRRKAKDDTGGPKTKPEEQYKKQIADLDLPKVGEDTPPEVAQKPAGEPSGESPPIGPRGPGIQVPAAVDAIDADPGYVPPSGMQIPQGGALAPGPGLCAKCAYQPTPCANHAECGGYVYPALEPEKASVIAEGIAEAVKSELQSRGIDAPKAGKGELMFVSEALQNLQAQFGFFTGPWASLALGGLAGWIYYRRIKRPLEVKAEKVEEKAPPSKATATPGNSPGGTPKGDGKEPGSSEPGGPGSTVAKDGGDSSDDNPAGDPPRPKGASTSPEMDGEWGNPPPP